MFEQMQGEPAMARMMSAMSDPASRNELESKIKTLRDEDPELAGVIDEIEKGGPQAMMKYWSDPEVLSKLGKGMEKVLEEHLGVSLQPTHGEGPAVWSVTGLQIRRDDVFLMKQ